MLPNESIAAVHPVEVTKLNVVEAVTSVMPLKTLKLPLAGVKLATLPNESAEKVAASLVRNPVMAFWPADPVAPSLVTMTVCQSSKVVVPPAW